MVIVTRSLIHSVSKSSFTILLSHGYTAVNTYFALSHCVLVISLFPVPNGCGLIPFGPSGVAETAVR